MTAVDPPANSFMLNNPASSHSVKKLQKHISHAVQQQIKREKDKNSHFF